MKRLATVLLVAIAVSLLAAIPFGVEARGNRHDDDPLRIRITVTNLTTGKLIKQRSRLTQEANFAVTVTTNGVDCAGQFVVTALGAPGSPPSVIVQSVPFVVGPALADNSATGAPLNSGTNNLWKISASCNGAERGQFDTDTFEFSVRVP